MTPPTSPLNTNLQDEIAAARNLALDVVDALDQSSDTLPDTPMAVTHVRAVKNALTGLHAVVRSFPSCEKGAA